MNEDNVTIIHPIQSDQHDQNAINNCIKIAKLNALNKQLWSNCCGTGCNLSSSSCSKCIATGSQQAEIMFIDALPSDYETFTGCLTDEKGYLLESILSVLKQSRSSLYCTTTVKCSVKQEFSDPVVDACIKHYLLKEIALIRPKKLILTIDAFHVCRKYNVITDQNNFTSFNYFQKQSVFIPSIDFSTNAFVVFGLDESLNQQQIEAFKQGLEYVLNC